MSEQTAELSPAAEAAGVAAAEAVQTAEVQEATAEVAVEAAVTADAAVITAESAEAGAAVATDIAVESAEIATGAEETAAVAGEAVIAVAAAGEAQNSETHALAQSAHARLDALDAMLAERAAAQQEPEVETVPVVAEGSSHDSRSGSSKLERERRHRFGR
jgi:hypothetical protein